MPSFPGLRVLIGGEGRELPHLEALAYSSGAPVQLLGRVPDERLPALLGAADIFVMACRNRWFGLEQEGFGIVFLEAAAAGVPQIAGDSGGAAEAVEDGVTGLVVADPEDAGALAESLRALLADPMLRRRMGKAARSRAQQVRLSSSTAARELSRTTARLRRVTPLVSLIFRIRPAARSRSAA